jgi:hypothetical protein
VQKSHYLRRNFSSMSLDPISEFIECQLETPRRQAVFGSMESAFDYEALANRFPDLLRERTEAYWVLWEWFDQHFDDLATDNETLNGVPRQQAKIAFANNVQNFERELRTSLASRDQAY